MAREHCAIPVRQIPQPPHATVHRFRTDLSASQGRTPTV
jgi:hypothetical protein